MGEKGVRSQANLKQLTLHLEPKNEVSLDNFCWHKQQGLQNDFLNIGTPFQKENFYYIYGANGSGKSHLLQACCHHIPTSQSSVYLPLKIYAEYGHELLNGFENQNLIAIDDIDVICKDFPFEESLFHLINRVRQNPDKTLILAGQHAPNLTNFNLPDLKSRLHLGLSVLLTPLEDEQKKQTLKDFAKQRGLVLSDGITEYLIQHYDRNMHTLTSLIRTLDKASLAAKRKITIPFIKEVLPNDS